MHLYSIRKASTKLMLICKTNAKKMLANIHHFHSSINLICIKAAGASFPCGLSHKNLLAPKHRIVYALLLLRRHRR